MCAAEATSELIQQCLGHERFRAAFERANHDTGDKRRQQCCLVDLSRAVRAALREVAHDGDALLRLLTETCSLYAAPPTRPPFAAVDAALDAREAYIAAHLLLVIRLDDDLRDVAPMCARLLQRLKPTRRVFIDVAAFRDLISIYGTEIRQTPRPWVPAAAGSIVSEWLPYLAQPLSSEAATTAQPLLPAKWSSIYIDVTECTADTKWELLEHLLLLRDLKRLRLEESSAICYIRWFPRTSGRESLYLNFASFLHGVIGRPRGPGPYPALRFICLARAWCHFRDNAAQDQLKFMPLLEFGATGDWIAPMGSDARRFAVSPDELQSILIRVYVALVVPHQRLRESSEAMYALHASGGLVRDGASPRISRDSAVAAAADPRPLPSHGLIQPMNYLEAVRGQMDAKRHPSYEFWQLAAYEAVWHLQVQLMARGYLRIPLAQLPPSPSLESIRALNAREIEIQSRRECTGYPLEDV
jgi:hypothetical protein